MKLIKIVFIASILLVNFSIQISLRKNEEKSESLTNNSNKSEKSELKSEEKSNNKSSSSSSKSTTNTNNNNKESKSASTLNQIPKRKQDSNSPKSDTTPEPIRGEQITISSKPITGATKDSEFLAAVNKNENNDLNSKDFNKKPEIISDIKSNKNNLNSNTNTTNGVFSLNNKEEAIVYDPSKPLSSEPIKANPPKYLQEKKDLGGSLNLVDQEILKMANNKNFTEVTGVGKLKSRPPKTLEFEPVIYVKELSPAGKAALELQESGDTEYLKILNDGYETPKTISSVIAEKITRVDKGSNLAYTMNPVEPADKIDKFWSNVEFHKYQNQLLDVGRYNTPAKFEKGQFGETIVHAPSNSDMRIEKPTDFNIFSYSGVEKTKDEIVKNANNYDMQAMLNNNSNRGPNGEFQLNNYSGLVNTSYGNSNGLKSSFVEMDEDEEFIENLSFLHPGEFEKELVI